MARGTGYIEIDASLSDRSRHLHIPLTRIVDQLKMAGDNSAALLLLDRELGARRDEAE